MVRGPADLARRQGGQDRPVRRRHRRHVHQGRLGPDRDRRPASRRWSPRPPHAAAALAGERTGTYFAPTGQRPSTRLLWLAHAAVARGALKLDDGAVDAVTVRRASLLPAGITGVDGAFDAGDPVDLADRAGAWSPAAWSTTTPRRSPPSWAAPPAGSSTKLGPEYEREVVHRDDLVIL